VVAPVENLTRLAGTVTARGPHPTLPDWDLVTLSVEQAQSGPGRADLLSKQAARPVQLAVRRDLLGAAGPGWRLAARAKLTQNGPLAESHPAPGDFRVEPG